MALSMNVRKAVTLNADVKNSADNKAIVALSSQISTTQNSNLNISVLDANEYAANKTEIRQMITEFQNEVWDTEDSMTETEEATEAE